MKFFQKIQENLAVMGFIPNQQENNHRLFSSRQIFCIVKFSIDIISTIVHIFYGADGVEEYMETIYGLTGVIEISIAFVSISFHNDKLFNIIQRIAEELNMSN